MLDGGSGRFFRADDESGGLFAGEAAAADAAFCLKEERSEAKSLMALMSELKEV